MSQRHKHAILCQDGASNERRVASSLVEAIDECRAEMVDPRKDPAVHLILHQLTFLLTGNDIADAFDWVVAMQQVEKHAQDQQP